MLFPSVLIETPQKIFLKSTVFVRSHFFQVLDDEAEVFVVKMWRLLIYETEAKKIGLVK